MKSAAGPRPAPARPRPATIEDVARLAGVSRQTVSRVINHGANVKPALGARVQQAIDELGYVPNMAARRMGGQRSFLLLALNDRDRTLGNWKAGRGNDWVDQMLFGAMMTCEAAGYRMLFELVDTRSPVAERQLAAALSSLRPDGVILTPPHTENAELAALLVRTQTLFARIGSHGHPDGINLWMDDAAAARAATAHLIGLGHRRIALIAGATTYRASALRLEGYRRAMAAAGLSAPADLVVEGDFGFASGERGVARLLALAKPPTAVIASNDEMAFAALHMADRHGIAVPEDLSVISFDDTPGVRFSVPPLTAIRQPIAPMAATAADLLIRAKRGESVPMTHALDFELVVRRSTAPPGC